MRKTLRSCAMETAWRPLPETAAAAGSVLAEVPPTARGLEAELAELERLSLDDLRLRWRNNWGRLAPAHLSRGLLFRVMAYRLQAGTFGDLDRKTVRLLERMADGAEEKLAANGSATPGSDEHAESKPLSARAAYGPLVSLSRPGMDAMPRSPFAQSPAGRLCSTCVRPCLASCSVSYLGLIRQSQRGFDRPGKPEICIAVLPSTQSETPVPPPKSDFET